MIDRAIYLFHGLFWATFLLRMFAPTPVSAGAAAGAGCDLPTPAPLPIASEITGATRRSPASTALIALHAFGFGLVYFGIGHALFSSGSMPERSALLPYLGAGIILSGAALVAWCLSVFRSWRVQARLDSGHQLSTDGPFKYVRHPIYLSMDLLVLGTMVWMPTLIIGVGVLVVAMAGDLRARAEERLLLDAFGDEYRKYMSRVKRFIPGVY